MPEPGMVMEPDAEPDMDRRSKVSFAVEPRTEILFESRVQRIEENADGVLIEAAGGIEPFGLDEGIQLALGQGYPTAVNVEVGSDLLVNTAVCAQFGILTGTSVWTSMLVDGESVEAGLDGGVVTLTALSEGRSSVVLEGTWEPADDNNSPPGCAFLEEGVGFALKTTLEVVVHGVSGIAVEVPELCAESTVKRLVSGTGLTGFEVRPLGSNGEAFAPANTVKGRDVGFSVVLSEGLVFGQQTADSLDAVALPEGAGTLSFEASAGDPVDFDIVGPESLAIPEVVFMLPGFAGSPLTLEDGASYDFNDYHRKQTIVLPIIDAMTVDGQQVCSQPGDWLELESQTPEVCPLIDSAVLSEKLNASTILSPIEPTLGADLMVSGVCSVVFSSDVLGGSGFSRAFSATFADVEGTE